MASARVARSARARVRVRTARMRAARARAARVERAAMAVRGANFDMGRASADVGQGHKKVQASGQQP
jgi:hypothetical protein